MKLSFKKSILLFTTVALGTMLGAAQDTGTNEITLVEGYTFKREWKSEVFPTPWENNRQGFGQDNKFFIHDKASSSRKVHIYGPNGFIEDLPATTGAGSNFTKDEAGNMLVRVAAYQSPYTTGNEIRIITPDGNEAAVLKLPSNRPQRRGDYWGFAQGDVMSAQGGKLIFVGQNYTYFYVVEIAQGAITEAYQVDMPLLFGPLADKAFSSEDVFNAWTDANGNHHFLAVQRSENPIDIILNDDHTATAKLINIQSYTNYGTSNGTNAFTFNGKNYIMFSTQPNWNDGFVIAELGTNADGTLDGTVNVVAQHVNDIPQAMTSSSKCNWLNWEPRDSKSIYIYQYFPGNYMARYIFGIKTDETELVDIVNDGEENETYTVADDILGVYIAEKDPTRVYAKDYNKHRHPSTIKDGETDFIKELAIEDAVLQDGDWDQSNWVLLDFGSNEEAQKYVRKVIKGGTLTGVLTNKLNPTMTVTESTVPTDEESYDENNYIGCNFMTPNVQSNICWHGETYNFFFIEPKPQEYVKVHWARYNGGSADGGHFDIVTDSELKGSFNVDWSLYPGNWEQDFIVPNAYSFHAIVRYVEGTKAGAVEGDYMVFPLEGGDIVTAIENVSTRGEVASVTYVNMLGVESSEPFAGINIVVTRYTTGETVIKKELHSNR